MRSPFLSVVRCSGATPSTRSRTARNVVLAAVGAYMILVGICLKKGRPSVQQFPEILRPYREFIVAVVNGWGKIMGWEPAQMPSEEKLIDEACKTCGLPQGVPREFDMPGEEPKWKDGFRIFRDALNKEARLNTVGGMIAKGWLIRYLQVRLRIIHAWKLVPQLDAVQVKRPIFILGLPRTGSTFLHNLIKQAQGIRCPLHWEMFDPIPVGKDSFHQHQMKCKDILENFKKFTPGIEHIHNNEWDMADECVNFMLFEFDGLTGTCMFNVSSHLKFITNRTVKDRDHVMRFHKRSVQFLQQREKEETPRTWCFKAPFWSLMIEEIEKYYPDALFVFTHRAPHKCMGSISSLNAKWWGASTDELDLKALGAEQVWMHEEMARRLVAARRRWKEDPKMANRIFDITLEELMKEPVDVVAKMFDHFGMEPLSAQSREQMDTWRKGDQVHAGKHPVQLEDFGLSKDSILASPAFAEYCKEFQVNTQ